MKCINIYRKEYIKCYNLVIDVTKIIKDFLYPNKYSFSRINNSLHVKEQLNLIRKDLESINFEREIEPRLMKELEYHFPVNESAMNNYFLDNIQLYLNPTLAKAKEQLENRYLPFIHKMETGYYDISNKNHDFEKAWKEVLDNKDKVNMIEKLISKIVYYQVIGKKDEEIDSLLKSHYKLEDIQFNRYIKGENNDYSSIRSIGIENKINVDFKKFDKVFGDILGQDDAIEKIKKTLMRNIMLYNADDVGKIKKDKQGPLSTFMFYGPTGTGKTEAAKKMAQFVYGNDNKLLILDMNSYKDPRVVASAIKGHPEGYVDSSKGTDFTRFLSKNKTGIVVLDEFEKASQEAREIFMNMLDEEKFKDALGNVYDLSGYIFIATTNVSKIFENRTRKIGFSIGSEKERKKSEEALIREKLREVFTAPILNRFSNVIGFKEINKDDAIEICKDLIYKTIKKFESKKFGGISPRISVNNIDKIIDILLYESDFSKDGVRSLKNVVNDMIGYAILEEISSRNINVVISCDNDKIVVERNHNKETKNNRGN